MGADLRLYHQLNRYTRSDGHMALSDVEGTVFLRIGRFRPGSLPAVLQLRLAIGRMLVFVEFRFASNFLFQLQPH